MSKNTNDLLVKKFQEALKKVEDTGLLMIQEGYVKPSDKMTYLVYCVSKSIIMAEELEAKLNSIYGAKEEPKVSDEPIIDNVVKVTPRVVVNETPPSDLKDS